MWALLVVLLGALLVAHVWADEATPLRCRDKRCRYIGRFQFDEDRYEVDGNELWVIYGESGGYLRIKCVEASVLMSPAMPRADPALNVWDVNVANCQLPAAGSLADKLAELNVTILFSEQYDEPRGNLTLENLPSAPPLTAKYFTGLENLISLHIYAKTRTSADPHFLSCLHRLRTLKLQDVMLDGELDAPPSLRQFTLLHTDVKRLPKVVYSSAFLLALRIESDIAFDAVAVPPELHLLDLQSPATTLRLDTVPMLEKLSLTNWLELRPPPLTRCDKLRQLHLTAPAIHALPHGWLANCSNLEELVIQNARNLTTLPQRLFGSSHLDFALLAFTDGVLERLFEGQFEDASELNTLKLNRNRLRTIPRNTLPWITLKELDLSSNDLDRDVLDMVAPCYWLTTLDLAYNPRLGDLCDEKGYSPLQKLSILRRLSLNKTNVTQICRDWRQDMPLLENLDLSNTSVSTLSFEDLQFMRTVKAKVLLLGAPLVLLEMTHDDFKKAKRTPTSGAFIHLDERLELECDCRMYWTRRTMDRSPHVLDRISDLRCAHNKLLRDLPLEDMVCARPEECEAASLPATCDCAIRPDDDPAWNRLLVRVRCEHVALDCVPRLSANSDHLYELLLAHNHITKLHASELHNIKGLDLRNNSLRRVDEETATRLGRMGGMLQLAGNPLDCDCSAAPLLQALHGRIPRSTDIGNTTCSDGSELDAAPAVDCPPSVAWLAGGFAAFFALAVTIIVYFASRERRFFVKAVLHRWGCLWRAETEEDERQYDAFVTYSHKDEAVVLELVKRLEPPYRLCLHHRDWIPGLRIPDQILESVRESRRTMALVSRHFLASTWARVEFREAHEAAMIDDRPRLIVVLLEEPAALPLDEQLQRYIATHTYVRWGDPWFYNKLAVALPRPRQHRAVLDSAPFRSSNSHATKLKAKRLPLDVRVLTSAAPESSSTESTKTGSAIELAPV